MKAQSSKAITSSLSSTKTHASTRDVTESLDSLSMEDTKICLSNLKMGRVIGEGGWGCVRFATHSYTKKTYAVKIMSKSGLIQQKQADHAKSEKDILESISHPFVVKMEAFEQDSRRIYFIQEFIRGGEFLTLLRQKRRLDIDCSRFFASQIFLFLKYLHTNNIIYRDLKPENMLVDKSGYIKFIDFGLSKKVFSKAYTVCGTPHYLAPEILLGKGYSHSADLYSFGVVLYEMLVGAPPIDGENHAELFQKIVHEKIQFPSNLDKKAKKLLKELLRKDPAKRISLENIEKISFFSRINFEEILAKSLEPPFFPSVKSDDDTSNFKKIKTPMLNNENCPKLKREDDIFLGW